MMKPIRHGGRIGLGLLALAIVSGCVTRGTDSREPVSVRFGALLSLSGDLAPSGLGERAAMEMAVADIGQNLWHRGRPVEVQILYADTAADPEQAYDQLRVLRREGIRSVIGPDSSEEAFRVLPWANRFGMILVSPSSTAPSLAIADDNLFRLAPDDAHQAQRMADRMCADGVRVVVPVWRDDQYAMDLLSGLRRAFLARGGMVMRGVRYDPTAPDWEATANQLRRAIEQTTSAYGVAYAAVYLIAFDEALPLMRASSESRVLSSVPWYTNEALAMNPTVISDETVASWAAEVRLTSPQLQCAGGRKAGALKDRLEAEIGYPPEHYALVAYDAVWLLTRAYLHAGKEADAAAMRRWIPRIAARTTGISGPLELNEAGDRALAAFDFFRVQHTAEGSAWMRCSE